MKITRRKFIGALTAAGIIRTTGIGQKKGSKIDRFALVTRHNPVLNKFEPLSPLSVGNGEFAFTCDPTGLQTFPTEYTDAMPLCTMSQWGWHSKPLPAHLEGKQLKLTEYDTYGRNVGYMTGKAGQEELFDWLRENPHRLHLGQIGFKLTKSDNTEAKPSDIKFIEQKLDLWTGILTSKFEFERHPVEVRTAIHPTLDVLAVHVKSPLLIIRKVEIRLTFPYGSSSMQAVDWTQPDKHKTIQKSISGDGASLERTLDNDKYFLDLRWSGIGILKSQKEHEFLLDVRGTEIGLTVRFSKNRAPAKPPAAEQVFSASEQHWKNFWISGAAVELIDSKDKRAKELERRIVLSQYLTAIQCSGSLPPQETGLTTNSWYGKYHLEMHWWHAAQFALWNRFPMLENSLGWYSKVLPSARDRAKQQGYTGARWAKMTAPDGRDSPSPVGTVLIWQQPHPIFYAELAYLNKPTAATLKKYASLVSESAEFMASYAHFDLKNGRYVLGPPVIPAQENHPARETWNPTFELEYWRYGLRTANLWRERLGLKPDPRWSEIAIRLSPLPVKDGVYMAHENCPQTFTERNRDHPSMLGALGILQGEMADRETMRRTLKKVMTEWHWPDTWGWDYPMTAMTAARLGETAIAIDALLLDTPKNGYAKNGHNYQRPNLPLYLPGNGGLLYAIAMMSAGWKGAPKTHAPGFPADGSWTVKAEGFNPSIFRGI